MADFDPFANQGGAAAWDPEHARDARKQADELLRRLAAEGDEPGSGPSTFSGDEAPDGDTSHDDDADSDPDSDSGTDSDPDSEY